NGKMDLIFKGAPVAFISTSGTSGHPKLIPESENGALAKNVTDKLRRLFSFGAHPDILQGKILPLVNASTIGHTPCGIPFGTASGLTLKSAPPELLATSAYPISTLSIPDDDALDYVLTRFAIENDVRMIIGNNIARMAKLASIAAENAERMIADIKSGTIDIPEGQLGDSELELRNAATPNPDRARELRGILDSGRPFIPSEYWRDLKVVCCWLSGSVGASVRGVEKLFGENVDYLDYGYGASEGKFNIPSQPGESAGTLAIHAGFYEFIPIDSDSTESDTLLAHQLVDGESYRMIVTNFSGLYRYDMKDIVKVRGFTGKTPNIVFVSKCGDIGNVAGEKLAGS
ncbi:MAG: GH3 auxin-responsive promoter family protein, partial [Victivallales bacterium]|nr:GH3 auxin-responsive promoter family protein [Victivallales bacterium]